MTVWLDEHFGPSLALWVGSTFGVDCKTLRELGLSGSKNTQLFDARWLFPSVVLLTKDHDFVELPHRKGPPPQVIWQRCPNMRTLRLQPVLRQTLPAAFQQIRNGESLVESTIKEQLGF
jgi:predicted nuclease of predicted toxin-antitoxin system